VLTDSGGTPEFFTFLFFLVYGLLPARRTPYMCAALGNRAWPRRSIFLFWTGFLPRGKLSQHM